MSEKPERLGVRGLRAMAEFRKMLVAAYEPPPDDSGAARDAARMACIDRCPDWREEPCEDCLLTVASRDNAGQPSDDEGMSFAEFIAQPVQIVTDDESVTRAVRYLEAWLPVGRVSLGSGAEHAIETLMRFARERAPSVPPPPAETATELAVADLNSDPR